MILWFAGLSLVAVWQVFRDPAIDHRLIAVGALAPDVIDAVTGRATLPHGLVFSVVLLLGVMVATRGRRQARRRLLALPIGTFMHLVLDGAWANTKVFWWPFFGVHFAGRGLPSLQRPVLFLVMQEVAGLAALVWFWRRFSLGVDENRRRFLSTGRLSAQLRG